MHETTLVRHSSIKTGPLSDLEEGQAKRIKSYYEGQNAHLIKGKKCEGYQPPHPVTVPSIGEMLEKNIQPRIRCQDRKEGF